MLPALWFYARVRRKSNTTLCRLLVTGNWPSNKPTKTWTESIYLCHRAHRNTCQSHPLIYKLYIYCTWATLNFCGLALLEALFWHSNKLLLISLEYVAGKERNWGKKKWRDASLIILDPGKRGGLSSQALTEQGRGLITKEEEDKVVNVGFWQLPKGKNYSAPLLQTKLFPQQNEK